MATTPPPGVPPSLQADLPDSSSAPSPPQKPTVLDAVKTINPVQDLQRLPSMPCARTSLLFGIAAGAAVGGLRFLFSRGGRGTLAGGNDRWGEVGAAANWAVGAWGVASLGAWETCRARQTAEATRMAALVSEIKSRQAAKAAKLRPPPPPSSSSSPSPLVGGAATSDDEARHPVRAGPRVGGVLVGERGKEMIREQQSSATSAPGAATAAKSDDDDGKSSWFRGRI
ncbi:hypothetical protein JCM11491_006698 [Sporobolomyces phaffii]